MVCLIVSCRTAFPCSWAHSVMIRSSHLDIVFTGNVSFWQRSVTLHNNNRKPTCILSHLDRQFACIRVGLFDVHDIISVEITIHGLQPERITRHSEYIIHESRLYSMSFPDSRSVFLVNSRITRNPFQTLWDLTYFLMASYLRSNKSLQNQGSGRVLVRYSATKRIWKLLILKPIRPVFL